VDQFLFYVFDRSGITNAFAVPGTARADLLEFAPDGPENGSRGDKPLAAPVVNG
jgi:hypothetical protein